MIRMVPFLLLISALLFANFVSSAHYIVGLVEDALDNTSANGRTVILWNPSVGMSDNVTDVVGPTGNSGVNRTYLIDCELLDTPCVVDDVLNVTLIDDGSGYVATRHVNVTVTGAGFDVAPNLSMNTPPQIVNFTVDDSFLSPANEIDLTAASNTTVWCTGVIVEYDGIGTLTNHSSELYSINSSSFGDADDNNLHYTNSSCAVNTSYGGPTEASLNCSYQVTYFANAEHWACMINLTDDVPVSANYSDQTVVNSLLALGVNDSIDFGTIDATNISGDTQVNITNYGNVAINLSLNGYGKASGDSNAMWCRGTNISISEMKYNLTSANPGPMNLSQTEQFYTNLTGSPVANAFNLASRVNDTASHADNSTYWRVRVPVGPYSSCNGTIIFGAVQN